MAPAGSIILATISADAASEAGFGALGEMAKQTGGALTGVDAALKIGKATLMNGIGGALGSGAGRVLEGEVIKRTAVGNPVVKKKIEDFVEGALAGAVQTSVPPSGPF